MSLITLTTEEFQQINNALYRLSLVSGCEELEQDIRHALKNAYEQYDTAQSLKREYYFGIRDRHGFLSIWDLDTVDLYDEHHFRGCTHVEYYGHLMPILGERWIDLWRAAENCIKESKDEHHIFIEGFYTDSRNVFSNVLRLSTGS